MTPIRPPRFLATRFGIIAATVAGFAIGAAGFAAAQHDDPAPAAASSDDASTTIQVSTTVDDTPAITIDDDRPGTTIDLTIPDPVDDGPRTTIDDGPITTVDDGPRTTVDDGPRTTVDDGPSTTVDDGPSTTIASSLPAPFTTSYSSAGGSINVTWNGAAFTLDSVSPATGFHAEIEDQAWDRVRVDFEGDDVDARIEVRINDGQLRVRID
jgi:hypothetical protein